MPLRLSDRTPSVRIRQASNRNKDIRLRLLQLVKYIDDRRLRHSTDVATEQRITQTVIAPIRYQHLNVSIQLLYCCSSLHRQSIYSQHMFIYEGTLIISTLLTQALELISLSLNGVRALVCAGCFGTEVGAVDQWLLFWNSFNERNVETISKQTVQTALFPKKFIFFVAEIGRW